MRDETADEVRVGVDLAIRERLVGELEETLTTGLGLWVDVGRSGGVRGEGRLGMRRSAGAGARRESGRALGNCDSEGQRSRFAQIRGAPTTQEGRPTVSALRGRFGERSGLGLVFAGGPGHLVWDPFVCHFLLPRVIERVVVVVVVVEQKRMEVADGALSGPDREARVRHGRVREARRGSSSSSSMP